MDAEARTAVNAFLRGLGPLNLTTRNWTHGKTVTLAVYEEAGEAFVGCVVLVDGRFQPSTATQGARRERELLAKCCSAAPKADGSTAGGGR